MFGTFRNLWRSAARRAAVQSIRETADPLHHGGMAPRCQVCIHPQLLEIHEQLLSGAARRRVARAFGLDNSAMDRHWANHMPAAMKAAAAHSADARGPVRMDVIDGNILLGLAAEQYDRSLALLDRLEGDMSKAGAKVDTRSVVAALREVRQSVDTLAKLSFAVQDRPGAPDASSAPAIDAAIIAALEARDVKVDATAAGAQAPGAPRPVLELMPAPDAE